MVVAFVHPMHPMHHAFAPMRRSTCSPCFGPSPFLVAFLAALFLPTILRVALFFFGCALHFAIVFGTVTLVTKAICALCADDMWLSCHDQESLKKCFAAAKMKSCFEAMQREASAKKKESSKGPCGCDPCGCGPSGGSAGSTVREALAEEKKTEKIAKRRTDLSTSRVEPTTEGVRIVVAAPGVSPSDVVVEFVEHTLIVKGETAKGADVYCADVQIMLPRQLDLASAQCTHADGALTITLAKKMPTRIVVTPTTTTTPAAQRQEAVVANETHDEAAVDAKADESSEGEWEPLSADQLRQRPGAAVKEVAEVD